MSNFKKYFVSLHSSFSYEYILTDTDGNQYAADLHPDWDKSDLNQKMKKTLEQYASLKKQVHLEILYNPGPYNMAFFGGLKHLYIKHCE